MCVYVRVSYFKHIARIAKPDYVPTVEDVLKARVRTSGIVEEEYVIEDTKFVYVHSLPALCV